jgi:hypothetical protein
MLYPLSYERLSLLSQLRFCGLAPPYHTKATVIEPLARRRQLPGRITQGYGTSGTDRAADTVATAGLAQCRTQSADT